MRLDHSFGASTRNNQAPRNTQTCNMDSDVFIIPANGSGTAKRISSFKGTDVDPYWMSPPAWSPDSRFLVVSMGDATSQGSLYRVSLSDTTAIPLLQGQGASNAKYQLMGPDSLRDLLSEFAALS